MKRLLILLWILLSALLPACEATPFTYDAVEAEAKRTGDTTRLERYEATAVKAEAFYELRASCIRNDDTVWWCSDRQRFDAKKPPTNTDELIRAYRWDHFHCACELRANMLDNF